MAIDDLPLPVVTFLNAIGVPWPYVNEDQVSEFATLTRQFGTAVQTTHEDATKAVSSIASAHRASSTQTMADGWDKLSAQHVSDIVDGCQVLAAALDAAAAYIVAQKAEAIAELVGMAAAFVADQAAAVVTFGLSEAALPLIEEAADKLMESLINDLQQYIVGQVVEAAAKPLFAKVEQLLSGLDWSQSGAADPGKGAGLELDAPAVKAQTAVLRAHATDMRAHATAYASGVRALGSDERRGDWRRRSGRRRETRPGPGKTSAPPCAGGSRTRPTSRTRTSRVPLRQILRTRGRWTRCGTTSPRTRDMCRAPRP